MIYIYLLYCYKSPSSLFLLKLTFYRLHYFVLTYKRSIQLVFATDLKVRMALWLPTRSPPISPSHFHPPTLKQPSRSSRMTLRGELRELFPPPKVKFSMEFRHFCNICSKDFAAPPRQLHQTDLISLILWTVIGSGVQDCTICKGDGVILTEVTCWHDPYSPRSPREWREWSQILGALVTARRCWGVRSCGCCKVLVMHRNGRLIVLPHAPWLGKGLPLILIIFAFW